MSKQATVPGMQDPRQTFLERWAVSIVQAASAGAERQGDTSGGSIQRVLTRSPSPCRNGADHPSANRGQRCGGFMRGREISENL